MKAKKIALCIFILIGCSIIFYSGFSVGHKLTVVNSNDKHLNEICQKVYQKQYAVMTLSNESVIYLCSNEKHYLNDTPILLIEDKFK